MCALTKVTTGAFRLGKEAVQNMVRCQRVLIHQFNNFFIVKILIYLATFT